MSDLSSLPEEIRAVVDKPADSHTHDDFLRLRMFVRGLGAKASEILHPDREVRLLASALDLSMGKPEHKSEEEVDKILEDLLSGPVNSGDICMHVGSLRPDGDKHAYVVQGVALTADGCKPVVVYQDTLNVRRVWVRHYDEFVGLVKPEGVKLPVRRFQKVGAMWGRR